MSTLDAISTIMSKDLITLAPTNSMADVHTIFSQQRIHHIPIVKGDRLVGIISKSDYLLFRRGFLNSKLDEQVDLIRLEAHSVSEVMTQGIAKLNSNERISVAVEVFNENLFHAIPIVDEEKLVGILTTFDFIKELSKSQSIN